MDFLSHILLPFLRRRMLRSLRKLFPISLRPSFSAACFFLCSRGFLLSGSGCRGLFTYYRGHLFSSVISTLFIEHDFQMSNAALVAVGAAHRRWTNALHARTVIGDRSFHIEPVHINVKTFFLAQVIGVLHGRAQQGKNVSCDTFLGERERGQRI